MLGFIITAIIIIIILIIKSVISSDKEYEETYEETIEEKGRFGELEVALVLGDNIENQKYILHDILFQTENGKTCQIDHVLINKNGIFVIETKNYSGKIFGSEKDHEWTQVLAYGSEKHKFYNPVKQNESHIYHLSKYLKAKDIYNNIVVFLDDANINNVSATNVYSLEELPYLINYESAITLNTKQIKYYYNKLLTLQENSNITIEEHINNIETNQFNIEHNICPRCGGNLVLRNGKYGQFYGCENYPKCKFTKK